MRGRIREGLFPWRDSPCCPRPQPSPQAREGEKDEENAYMNTPAATPSILPDACPRLPRGVRLVHHEAHGGWVLLAAEIVKRCTGEASFEAIVDDLAATFAAPRERVAADVATLLQGLADKKLLEL